MRKIKRYGWMPDLPDARDQTFTTGPSAMMLPTAVDLRPQCAPVLDQGALGSCTANAIASAFQFIMAKQANPIQFTPSRLFIYYNERVMEDSVDYDSGAQIRDGIKSVAVQGVCPEEHWPYNIGKFTDKPSDSCYAEAQQDQALRYRRISANLSSMLTCLAMGLPFVFGFTVYDAFESQQVATTGVLDMPKQGENVLGGHAVMAVGYDRVARQFIVRNSWGTSWGVKGYFRMPFDYLTNSNLADDRWVISKVEVAPGAVAPVSPA